MIESLQEFLGLVELYDEPSKERLRWDPAPPTVWEEVISRHPDLKEVVALNKNLDEDTIRILSKDNTSSIRCSIAQKRRLPRDVFDLLATDEDEAVRARIARNLKTPIEIVQRLLHDPSWVVVDAAKTRIDLL